MTTEQGKVPKNAIERLGGKTRKGAPNKQTAQLKEMILGALDASGGVDYLTERANDPRTASAFLSLIGKVLPMTIANEDGKAFQVSIIERVIVKAPN